MNKGILGILIGTFLLIGCEPEKEIKRYEPPPPVIPDEFIFLDCSFTTNFPKKEYTLLVKIAKIKDEILEKDTSVDLIPSAFWKDELQDDRRDTLSIAEVEWDEISFTSEMISTGWDNVRNEMKNDWLRLRLNRKTLEFYLGGSGHTYKGGFSEGQCETINEENYKNFQQRINAQIANIRELRRKSRSTEKIKKNVI